MSSLSQGLRWTPLVSFAALLTAVLCVSPPAAASATAQLSYTRLQVYSGALRFLRIDLGYEITEKDADAAYLLFKYPSADQQRSSFGAFEIIETEAGIRLSVKLPKMPSYHEDVLRDELLRKLRDDYGEANRSAKDKPKTKPKHKPRSGDEPDDSDRGNGRKSGKSSPTESSQTDPDPDETRAQRR